MNPVPNFLYIGTSKAGSTWIFKVLSWHPQIWMYPGKNLGFFSTRYDKGVEWYLDHFPAEPAEKIVGEVSHSYLVSKDAARRIRKHLPSARMMVCLRDPVQRTFSDYLDGLKNGKLHGSFEEELERTPALVERSRYASHLARYLGLFERGQIHIGDFAELESEPASFASKLFEFLEVDPLELPPRLRDKVLPGGTPRSPAAASAAKRLSKLAARLGLRGLRGKVKTSRTLRNLLYRPFDEKSRPRISAATEQRLRELMTEEVQRLDMLAGTNFCRSWGYPEAGERAAAAASRKSGC
jgi:hypothetical protein